MNKPPTQYEQQEQQMLTADFDNSYFDDDLDSPPPDYTPGPSPYQNVPVGWNIYSPRTWSLRTYFIGSHADQPRFVLETRTALFASRPCLILYDGTDTKTSPQLATVHRAGGFWKSHSQITILGRPGSSQPTVSEKLTAHLSRHDFSFDVGLGKETRRHHFEWRKSHGKEVKALNESKWSHGWKLVHLGLSNDRSGQTSGTHSAPSSGTGSSSGQVSRSQRPHGESSDGLPIVAIFSENSKMSMNKLARFYFVGAGATGEFGEPWALFVTMSALRIWEIAKNARAGAAGASGGAVAAC